VYRYGSHFYVNLKSDAATLVILKAFYCKLKSTKILTVILLLSLPVPKLKTPLLMKYSAPGSHERERERERECCGIIRYIFINFGIACGRNNVENSEFRVLAQLVR
jgi:hypothetical protein